jgi:hypothetical protein
MLLFFLFSNQERILPNLLTGKLASWGELLYWNTTDWRGKILRNEKSWGKKRYSGEYRTNESEMFRGLLGLEPPASCHLTRMSRPDRSGAGREQPRPPWHQKMREERRLSYTSSSSSSFREQTLSCFGQFKWTVPQVIGQKAVRSDRP